MGEKEREEGERGGRQVRESRGAAASLRSYPPRREAERRGSVACDARERGRGARQHWCHAVLRLQEHDVTFAENPLDFPKIPLFHFLLKPEAF